MAYNNSAVLTACSDDIVSSSDHICMASAIFPDNRFLKAWSSNGVEPLINQNCAYLICSLAIEICASASFINSRVRLDTGKNPIKSRGNSTERLTFKNAVALPLLATYSFLGAFAKTPKILYGLLLMIFISVSCC